MLNTNAKIAWVEPDKKIKVPESAKVQGEGKYLIRMILLCAERMMTGIDSAAAFTWLERWKHLALMQNASRNEERVKSN